MEEIEWILGMNDWYEDKCEIFRSQRNEKIKILFYFIFFSKILFCWYFRLYEIYMIEI